MNDKLAKLTIMLIEMSNDIKTLAWHMEKVRNERSAIVQHMEEIKDNAFNLLHEIRAEN